VEFEHKGQVETVFSNKEVISSAGSIGSVQLLQLSGIGPRDVLENAGVEVKHELPGVGQNLQDHLEVYFQYRCEEPITLNSKLGLISKGMIGAEWLLTKRGLGATNHFESCAFIRSRAGLKWPNIQYHFLPAAMRYDGRTAFDGHGFQVHVGPNKPLSRGQVWIRSNDPADKPGILFRYLSEQQDIQDWRDCIRLTREILAQPALSLRVVDSSIFPTIPNGNLNAPTIMVAERAADIILGKTLLPREQAPVWIAENWQQDQRENAPRRSLDSLQSSEMKDQ